MVDGEKTEVDREPPVSIPPAVVLSRRYRIDGILGKGGMGTVYRVHDLELDEAVALKMLSQLDAESLGQFRAEVKLARKVTHPNVARTFDIGEDAGRRFLTMELVEGPSLDRLLATRRLDLGEAVRLGRDVCAGLRAVHEMGIVHGDLKPSNVLVSAGRAKLTDFGIARSTATEVTGPWPGTPSYMAPERALGTPSDRPGDVYALGLVLAELFGLPRRRRRGAASELDLATIDDETPRLAALIRRCLANDPAERPADLDEIETALVEEARSARGTTTPARRVGVPERRLVRVAIEPVEADVESTAIAIELGRQLALSTQLLVPSQLGPDEAADATLEVRHRSTSRGRVLDLRLVSSDGLLVWGRSSILDDVPAELESAASAIVTVLTTDRTSNRASLRIDDPETHELYLEAVALELRRSSDRDIDCVPAFEKVLARAPGSPLALSGLASALANRSHSGDLSRARALAERALLLAPNLASTHDTIALLSMITNDGEGAARSALRAVSLAPSAARGQRVLGAVIGRAGRLEEGLGRLQLSLALDPKSPNARVSAASLHAFRDDIDAAIAVLEPLNEEKNASNWFYWLARVRLGLRQNDPATTRALVAGLRARPVRDVFTNYADFLEGTFPIAEVVRLLDSLGADSRDRLYMRTVGLELQAECAEWVKELDVVERVIVALDEETASYDIAWMDHCRAAIAVRDRPAVVRARERIAARAAKVLAAVDREADGRTTG